MKRTVFALSITLPILLLLAFFAQLVHATTNPWTDGQDASFVIGQPDFTSASYFGVSDTSLDLPKGVAIDVEHGKIYVADYLNHRVLRYAYPFEDPQPAAEIVFGQPNFTTHSSGVSQTTLNNPISVIVDNSGRLWVAESSNHRVIWFDEAYAVDSNQPPADGVLGQPDFDSNTSATTQNGMNRPYNMAIDASSTLYVADAYNHRVLRFDNAAAKANGANADGILGQLDFTSNAPATTQSGMNSPRGVALYKGSLFVADRNNHRVLRFDNAANKANGANADGVLGQPDFTSNTSATTQSGMSSVARVFVDDAGRLYVSDIFSNHRILIFNNASSLPNGAPADNVLGQTDFTSSGSATAANRLNADSSGASLAIDHVNNRLFVADDNNNRVLGFQASESLTYPILTLTKQASDPAPRSGDTVTYTVTITNSGSADATGSVISDTIPAGLSFVNGSTTLQPAEAGTTGNAPTLVSDLTITPGQTIIVTYQAAITADSGLITNTAEVASTEVTTPLTATDTISVQLAEHKLTVSVTGDGAGTISSSPAGIDCGADCSESYVEGTAVTLNANYDANEVNFAWAGACTSASGDNCELTMDQAYNVEATFTVIPPAPTECVASSSGNWSEIFAGCAPGSKYVIPEGLTVVLDEDIELAGDFELEGTLDPNGKTVTLTGGEDQRLAGDPLTFYNLVLNKDTRRDKVFIDGKLQVQNRLRIQRGRLRSASDYHHVQIDAEGVLELTSEITVSGDWTNDGELVANGHTVNFDGDALQTLDGTETSLFYDLVVGTSAQVAIETTPDVTNTLSNNGVLQQTQVLDGSADSPASFNFLQVSDDKYRGVDISTEAALGEVTVAVAGNSGDCAAYAPDFGYRNRCFTVTAKNEGLATLTFYSTAAEDDVEDDVLYLYQQGGAVWTQMPAVCAAEDGSPCTVADISLAPGDNPFLVGGTEAEEDNANFLPIVGKSE